MKGQLSCIVVDDCELDRKAVAAEILCYDDFHLAGSFGDCADALTFFKTSKPNVLFVDVDMPGMNGLELIKSIDAANTLNIIISSYPEYAVEGFQLKVFDFILKPITSDRFESTINRLRDFISLKSKAEAYDVLFEHEQIVFKDGLITVKLDVADIVYLEAFGDYTKIVTPNKVHLTLATLTKFLESLPPGKFMRIHRSFVVALNKVKSFGQKQIDMEIHSLPVGKTYFKEAKRKINAKKDV